MSVYVDKAAHPYRGMLMCHMVADTPAELHAMADKIGVVRRWFQDPRTMNVSTPHYDVCRTMRRKAVKAGAVECDRNDFVAAIRRIRASGAFL